ncbi:class I adenylate-forming enzyme family protein [Micromonospora echinospora]|uniref:class I adenylate-forming enzyme family protein n=1 Tax=Micromonospora echinospora TaxID=1877 RepID=UPI003673398E
MSEFSATTIERYYADGSWDADTISDLVARNAASTPDAVAFHAPEGTLTWQGYDAAATRLAGAYVLAGWTPGQPVAVLLTGGALTHVAYLAAQRAGLVTVGLGPRAGDAEIGHLLRHTGAVALVSRAAHRGRPAAEIARSTGAPAHLEVDLVDGVPVLSRAGVPLPVPEVPAAVELLAGRGLGSDDLFFLNSTSGTTGRPKCVRQSMNVRKYFAALAADAGAFGPDEVVLSALPAPYAFGLWSAHVVPARYRFPTVLTAEFDPGATLDAIERHRVTVLAAVTSQFIMLLNHGSFARRDLGSLRVLFTGGERVPAHRAAEFEERTGCRVLQFYGSNEAGPISVTRVDDPPAARLGTAGRPVPAMRLRLLGPDGDQVSDGPGQVAVNGPGCSSGYFRDEEANRLLFRPDGWLRTGDLGRLDDDGYLSVTGRTADFIIRGGHNVSAPVVEEAVGGHPRVAQVAVIGVPDEVLGERVCAFVVTREGGGLTLDELRVHLDATGVSKVNWPERLVELASLPLGTGGKVDKAALRALL